MAASVVVFLVALPLCVGVAVASGVPAELGLVTGIVGGLVVGVLPGSSLQVSGPAAGLTVLVYEAVREYGVQALGVLVVGAGVVQLGLGALRLGRWFRAVSVAVVQGMLAGIGLVLVAGQVYALGDVAAPGGGGIGKLVGLGALPGAVDPVALAVGGATVVVLVVWPRWRWGVRFVPAPLVAVGGAALVTWVFDLGVRRVEVRGLLEAVRVPSVDDLGLLAEVGVVGTVLAFALIASAESLFSAAAVDQLHDGPRTDYDRELVAQGVGNVVCGALGALPMTAVIVRSAANVRAGARTKASRVLHGMWLLVFAALLPGVLGVIPVAALAGLLVHAGCKLVPVQELGALWRGRDRGEMVVLGATALAIVAWNLFEGVLVGLALAVAKTAWDISHVHVETEDRGDAGVVVRVVGNATFLRLPTLLDALEGVPRERGVRLELSGLRHVDHACAAAMEAWAAAWLVDQEGKGKGEEGDSGSGVERGTGAGRCPGEGDEGGRSHVGRPQGVGIQEGGPEEGLLDEGAAQGRMASSRSTS
ncbi:SulP family inorganic anion transporter [Streptomyces sp. DSM 40750]|uniref:SulP family inorganic anion transporter n=1 Tax=Streptomyces sp. DSM 40750 TaxID=2801030 RepID=UPI00214C2FDF|nr:SulP family inorganic anion transporter [Streptomyces sp. DSM 40750]UUU24127.1 SulP family inorganic anion transporter [Streptomyces sp. DSM 40750]